MPVGHRARHRCRADHPPQVSTLPDRDYCRALGDLERFCRPATDKGGVQVALFRSAGLCCSQETPHNRAIVRRLRPQKPPGPRKPITLVKDRHDHVGRLYNLYADAAGQSLADNTQVERLQAVHPQRGHCAGHPPAARAAPQAAGLALRRHEVQPEHRPGPARKRATVRSSRGFSAGAARRCSSTC